MHVGQGCTSIGERNVMFSLVPRPSSPTSFFATPRKTCKGERKAWYILSCEKGCHVTRRGVAASSCR